MDNARHRGWLTARQAVYRALIAAGAKPSQLLAFAVCGHYRWIQRNKNDPSLFRAVTAVCHNRWCSPCAGERRALIRENLANRLTGVETRLITLTIASTPAALRQQINRLYTAWRRLRRWQLWKERVTGGIAFFELTFNPTTRHWHPHLHILAIGKYLPQAALATQWRSLTGDSYVVDVRRIYNAYDAANYVSKYATKPLPKVVFTDPAALTEAVSALRGRRLVIPFGTCHRWHLTERPDDPDWQPYCHETELALMAARGNETAAAVLAALRALPPNEPIFRIAAASPEQPQAP